MTTKLVWIILTDLFIERKSSNEQAHNIKERILNFSTNISLWILKELKIAFFDNNQRHFFFNFVSNEISWKKVRLIVSGSLVLIFRISIIYSFSIFFSQTKLSNLWSSPGRIGEYWRWNRWLWNSYGQIERPCFGETIWYQNISISGVL